MSITLAQLGWVHEVGTKVSGRGRRTIIPARPFLIPGIQENRSRLLALERDLLLKVLRGQMSKRDAMGRLGVEGQTCVQEKIRNGPFEPLADSTKLKKTVRGKSGDTPLWDSGNMIQHVQWAYEE